MSTTPTEDRPSKTSRAVGHVISALIVVFMLFDAISHIAKPQFVLDANAGMFPENKLVLIGAVALIVTVLYAIPRTAILGAVLLTGYYGGAVAIHLNAGHAIFTQTLFPVYFGILAWLGLYLRDQRVRSLARF
jgi:DoxX-like family